MEWYDRHQAPDMDGPRLARWTMKVLALGVLTFLIGWGGAWLIRALV